MCLLELRGLQVVHSYHSAVELKTVDTAASENYQREREAQRERERKREKSFMDKSEWKIYLKRNSPLRQSGALRAPEFQRSAIDSLKMPS